MAEEDAEAMEDAAATTGFFLDFALRLPEHLGKRQTLGGKGEKRAMAAQRDPEFVDKFNQYIFGGHFEGEFVNYGHHVPQTAPVIFQNRGSTRN